MSINIFDKKFRVLLLVLAAGFLGLQLLPTGAAPQEAVPTVPPAEGQPVNFDRKADIRAWVPASNFEAAVEQIRGPQKLRVDEAVMFGYVLQPDGTVRDGLVNREAEMRQLRAEGVRIVAGVYNERDGERVTDMLASVESRQQHMEQLVAIAKADYLSGLEVGYERMSAEDRPSFSQFIKELAEMLHQEGKTLAVTVHAKTTDGGLWHGTAAQDWRLLGTYADAVVILAYDYSWETSAPGPIAPTDWVREVVEYGLTQVAPEKLVIGVPAFGYDWNAHCEVAPALSLQEIEDLALATGAAVVRDEATGKPRFIFRDEGGCPHEVWYEDAESIKPVVEMVKNGNLKGVSIWPLGGVTTPFFTVFSDQL